MTDQDEMCPCGSGKPFEECCKQEYDRANATREKIKQAMSDPKKAEELKELLKNANKGD